ncbi:hypothetical protein LPJ61_003549 [Coemansia biformis]|uniref:Thioredoxin domain-containing protein n=1 Tax=Coemansia biformis TaxID=1286918 RepID=A0A9W8CVG7_9FUNG|nr:hypothetical protein LPJ61_003549 [Coemansia biformis]
MKLAVLTGALAAVASGYTLLDANNLDASVKEGYWLVKYYSPTCPWSRRFAPTWEKVYTTLEDVLAEDGVHFGEIDCKANRAKCDEARIDGYPTVVFYNQGVNKGEVPGGQSYEALASFAQSI